MTGVTAGQAAYEAAVRVMLDGDTEAGRVPDEGPDYAWDAIGRLERDSWEAAAQAAIAAQQPQPAPGDTEAAFASGVRVRTVPCTASGHDGDHLQVRTNGHWVCGRLLASLLADGVPDEAAEKIPANMPAAPELAAAMAESNRYRQLAADILAKLDDDFLGLRLEDIDGWHKRLDGGE